MCKRLVNVLVTSLESRFEHVFQWDTLKEKSLPFVLATISAPQWKLRWIESSEKKVATSWLLESVESFSKNSNSTNTNTSTNMNDGLQLYSFIEFAASTCDETEPVANLQVVQYTCDNSTNYITLKNYPLVEQVFFKYNTYIYKIEINLYCKCMLFYYKTGLPSSAPVERLFSYAGIVLSAKRTKLKDDLLEKLTLLKANKFD